MQTLGFEAYAEPLKVYLAKFRESEKHAMSHASQGKASGLAHSNEVKDA